MTNHRWFEQSGDELDDHEYPDDDYDNDDDQPDTVACPECGAEIYTRTPFAVRLAANT